MVRRKTLSTSHTLRSALSSCPRFRHEGGQKCRHAVTPLRQLELTRDGTKYVPYTNHAKIEAYHAAIKG